MRAKMRSLGHTIVIIMLPQHIIWAALFQYGMDCSTHISISIVIDQVINVDFDDELYTSTIL